MLVSLVADSAARGAGWVACLAGVRQKRGMLVAFALARLCAVASARNISLKDCCCCALRARGGHRRSSLFRAASSRVSRSHIPDPRPMRCASEGAGVANEVASCGLRHRYRPGGKSSSGYLARPLRTSSSIMLGVLLEKRVRGMPNASMTHMNMSTISGFIPSGCFGISPSS